MATAVLFAGQGSQHKGMGADLFDRFPEHGELAGDVLGYSIEELCSHDPDGRLGDTRYAQPALFVVNALRQLASPGDPPDFLAGHSLGELNALHAAGCFDFPTGVRLVRRRGEEMARVTGGGMLAIVGIAEENVGRLLADLGIDDLDVANHNSSTQFVLSGPVERFQAIIDAVGRAGPARCIPLAVSAPFHSRYMADAAAAMAEYLRGIPLADPEVPVLSNVTGRPYPPGRVAELMAEQIRRPVRWRQSMWYLAEQGVTTAVEIGPGRLLAPLWESARAEVAEPTPAEVSLPPPVAPVWTGRNDPAEQLGSAAFRAAYGVRYAYLSGSMFHGIASVDLVIQLAKAGLFGFFGAGGITLRAIQDALLAIQAAIGDRAFGMNLLSTPDDPVLERETVELYLRHGVRFVEAAAFTRVTPAIVRFRFAGAHVDEAGGPEAVRRLLAKVSRPETAEAFLRPPPDQLLAALVAEGGLTEAEAEAARLLPVASDVCVEADSGGHTDRGVALVVLPAIVALRDRLTASLRYAEPIPVGASGGLGTPSAVSAAFVLGADFVVTGSVNQCSPEAGTSDLVKDMLSETDVMDTTFAPAGDLFEVGAQVQVVRRGTLFAARANRLHQLYNAHGGLADIDADVVRDLEEKCFRRSVADVWRETREHYLNTGRPETVARAERDAKHRMALVFKWYFARSCRLAMDGIADERTNFQIHCGPAMGAFNRFARDVGLADWRTRHVDAIAEVLMTGAADLLRRH